MCEPAANLHGAVPLAVLAGEEFVVPLQSVALVTEVLDDSLLGEAVAGRRVTAVAPVLWFSGGRTHWEEAEEIEILRIVAVVVYREHALFLPVDRFDSCGLSAHILGETSQRSLLALKDNPGVMILCDIELM